MSAVTEVVILTLQPGAKIDEHMRTYFAILEKQKGFQGAYWGRWSEIEDRMQIFVQWDELLSKKAFKSGPDAARAGAAIRPFLREPPAVHHVHFTPDAMDVLAAPVVEVTTFYNPVSSFADDSQELTKLLTEADGCLGIAKGPILEELGEARVKAYQVLVGWESVKKHEEAMGRREIGERVGNAIQAAKKVEMHHVELTAV